MSILAAETQRFLTATSQMKELLSKIDAEVFHKKPSAEQWSVVQIVSHIDEAIWFWIEDLKALQIVPGAKWGRNHEHVRRLVAVTDLVTEKLTPEISIAKLDALDKAITEVFATVTEEQLATTAPSYNANFDGKPLSFLINHLIVMHTEGHLGQMERHLELVQATV